MNRQIYALIMAGGSGKRLWPLSRTHTPKQFIKLHNDTLLGATLSRLKQVIPAQQTIIITTQEYYGTTLSYQNQVSTIIQEPMGKNTGPALLYALLTLYKQDPTGIVIVNPADHAIQHNELYAQDIKTIITAASHQDMLYLIGCPITSPSTQYGYLNYSPEDGAHGCYAITKFHEKPSLETAQLYQHNPHMLWNSGIFCAKISVFLELYQAHAPALYEQVNHYLQGTGSYEDISPISFDCAVVEKTTSCAVLPAHFDWSDVGTIEQFLSFKNTQQQEQVIAYRSKNNTVSGTKKVVALFAVNDLCIIETDDIVYIAAKSELEQVHEFIDFLKTHGHNQFL